MRREIKREERVGGRDDGGCKSEKLWIKLLCYKKE